jgi:tetratricopeptide (TPR) repeat protein
MDTLRYFAAQLGKPVSFFLDEEAVTSPNQQLMDRARTAWAEGDFAKVRKILETYRDPDPVFDGEKVLLQNLAALELARMALVKGKRPMAVEILNTLDVEKGYCGTELTRQRLLLMGSAQTGKRREICRQLPSIDEELLLRAEAALEGKNYDRAGALLEAAEDRESLRWHFLRGEVYMAQKRYDLAAEHYRRAEEGYPRKTASRLERCYRELEDYKQAYFYACKQRKA